MERENSRNIQRLVINLSREVKSEDPSMFGNSVSEVLKIIYL